MPNTDLVHTMKLLQQTLLLVGMILSFAMGSVEAQTKTSNPVKELEAWLEKPVDERGDFSKQEFRNAGLKKDQAEKVKELLWSDYVKRTKKSRQQEWKDKVIKLGDLSMKFDYKIYGEKPKSGRSLFISMHGGGGTRARVNDQQWRNQIGLYQPEEGVYLAPRAPTNKWNLWHEPHIDKFFKRIIQDAILLEDVDPNRVYIMGYSAGGDGVYQLAPRMADYLAAAAMMAGHPNGVSPRNLRNIGFTLHMGGKDRAYKRNDIARKWKKKLADLKEWDSDGYEHEVIIHEEFGHWMQKKDAVAVPWMAKFTRNPRPEKIVWRQSGVKHDSFYWLAQKPEQLKANSEIIASKEGQTFTIESFTDVNRIDIQLNDQVVDLDESVVVDFGGGTKFSRKLSRQLSRIYDSIEKHGDPEKVYSARFSVPFPQEVLERAAAKVEMNAGEKQASEKAAKETAKEAAGSK